MSTRARPSFGMAGVNYSVAVGGTDANWAADMAYFKSIKDPNTPFTINIVCNNDKVSVPWTVGTSNNNGNFADSRNCALFFAADPAFHVVFNIWYSPTTRDLYSAVTTAMVAEATYLQSFGLPIEISVGNEISGTYGLNFGISSLTQTGGVATCQAVSNFLTHVGDTITIYGSTRSQYNSTFTVTSVIDSKTFTFNVDSATVNPGNGTLISMEYLEFFNMAKAAATAIKTVYTVGKVSLAEFDGITHSVSPYAVIAAQGLGDLDYLAAHVYPSNLGTPAYMKDMLTSSNSSSFAPLVAALGTNKIVVGEMNLSASSISNMIQNDAVQGMRILYNEMNALGIKRVVIWSWNTNLAMKNTDGTFHYAWGVVASNNGRIPLKMYNQSRQTVTGRPTIRTGQQI